MSKSPIRLLFGVFVATSAWCGCRYVISYVEKTSDRCFCIAIIVLCVCALEWVIIGNMIGAIRRLVMNMQKKGKIVEVLYYCVIVGIICQMIKLALRTIQ